MPLAVETITIDCADPDSLAQWWAEAVGGKPTVLAAGEFVVVNRSDGLRLAFQRVPDPTPGKNRLHIDFSAADLEAEVERLVRLGAVETGRHTFGDQFRWVVLADPDGNAFCVGAEEPAT